MKSPLFVPAVLALCLACGVSRNKVLVWLDKYQEPAQIDVSGTWESPNGIMAGGWGGGSWVQTSGNVVTGALGFYSVNGKVAGKTVYLFISSGSKIYYTAILETKPGDKLEGIAYKGVPGDTTTPPEAIALVKYKPKSE